MYTDVLEALVEDDGAIRNMLPKLEEGIGHVLQVVAVIGDGEVPLGKVAKLGFEEERPSFLIAEELRLDGEPGSTGGGVALHDGFGEIGRQSPEEPGSHNAVHPNLVWGLVIGSVGKDMTLQRVLAKDE